MNEGNGKQVDPAATPRVSHDPGPPMTASLMARLFGVPLLIVTLIIGSAVVVVLLFGSISSEQERSVDDLLAVMDREPTGKVFDVALMPADKEIWQAGKELAARLQKKDAELSTEDLQKIVARLSALIARDLPRSASFREDRRGVLHFAIAALGATGEADSIAPLRKALHAEDWQTRREALKALGAAHKTVGARASAAEIASLLDDPEATVRTVAAFVLTFLASPQDEDVLAQLQRACARPGEDREVRWNAALTLARLGSSRSKDVLLAMLDRRYWAEGTPVRLEGGGGGPTEKPMPPGQVEAILRATVEAASNVQDADVRQAIEALGKDESLLVREAVRAALERLGKKTENLP
ncbi:MAG: HEAT repeat domain-containing protein [Phycisphaerales bacterium]|nr:HEAT repeat domain-containing protein [Phycisphaerales bacterium]